MRFVTLNARHRGMTYFLEKITGSLLCLPSQYKAPLSEISCSKVEEALRICHNPYLIKFQSAENTINQGSHSIDAISLKIARQLVKLSSFNFWLSCRYASFGRPMFSDAAQAIRAFHCHTATQDRNVLCLPRALFAARMSQKFTDKGVVIIGVFLPSRSLHAWVIEDGIQPDSTDHRWIHFQPVAALY